jgi:micrococcal nuclease
VRPLLVLLLALSVASISAPAWALTGVVTHVTDGDTLWVRTDAGTRLKLRLQGLDAPERCQAWGPQARDALAARVMHRQVDVQTKARDDYQRTIARVTLQGEDVGAWMVGEGHAWSARFRRSPGPYATQEATARAARRGLFAQLDAVEPRAFRKAHGPCR